MAELPPIFTEHFELPDGMIDAVGADDAGVAWTPRSLPAQSQRSASNAAKSDEAYDERPELKETFADTVRRMTFDGRTLRVELCVRREVVADNGLTVQKFVPISRLVFDLEGAIDLMNKMNTLEAQLEKNGYIRVDRPVGQATQRRKVPA